MNLLLEAKKYYFFVSLPTTIMFGRDIREEVIIMAALQETQHLSFTNTADAYATFGLDIQATGSGVQSVMLRTSADCYIDFDKEATSDYSFLLKSTDEPTIFDFPQGSIMKVHARGVSGSGTLYLLGIRD